MIGELRDESVGSKVLVLVEREVAGGTRLMDSEEETYLYVFLKYTTLMPSCTHVYDALILILYYSTSKSDVEVAGVAGGELRVTVEVRGTKAAVEPTVLVVVKREEARDCTGLCRESLTVGVEVTYIYKRVFMYRIT